MFYLSQLKSKEQTLSTFFIQPGIEYLLLDTAKRYFSLLEVSELHECQVLTKEVKVCKQKMPLQLTQVEEVCEIQMTESIRAIPSYCPQRNVELNHTLWQQLFEDEWLFVARRRRINRIVCEARPNRCHLDRDR